MNGAWVSVCIAEQRATPLRHCGDCLCERQHENLEAMTYLLLLMVNLHDQQSSLSTWTQHDACAHRTRAVSMGGAAERSSCLVYETWRQQATRFWR